MPFSKMTTRKKIDQVISAFDRLSDHLEYREVDCDEFAHRVACLRQDLMDAERDHHSEQRKRRDRRAGRPEGGPHDEDV